MHAFFIKRNTYIVALEIHQQQGYFQSGITNGCYHQLSLV